MEGYMHRKVVVKGNKLPWEQFYFVLKSNVAELHLYKDCVEFKSGKNSSVQPKDQLIEFGAKSYEVLFDLSFIPMEERKSVIHESSNNQFLIIIVCSQYEKSVRYILRCDTKEEWTLWKESLVKVTTWSKNTILERFALDFTRQFSTMEDKLLAFPSRHDVD